MGSSHSSAPLPVAVSQALEAEAGIEPAYRALQALAYATRPLRRRVRSYPGADRTPEGVSERTTGFEPATLTLAR